MFFNKKEKLKKQASKIDKLVTWLIIWWAVASMIGLSNKKTRKTVLQNAKENWEKFFKKSTKVAKNWYSVFWRIMVWVLKIFNKK